MAGLYPTKYDQLAGKRDPGMLLETFDELGSVESGGESAGGVKMEFE